MAFPLMELDFNLIKGHAGRADGGARDLMSCALFAFRVCFM